MAPPRRHAVRVSSSSSSLSDGEGIGAVSAGSACPSQRRYIQEEEDDDEVQVLDGPITDIPLLTSLPQLGGTARPADTTAGLDLARDLEQLLQRHGVRPSFAWLESCIQGLTLRPDFLRLSKSQQAECCFSCFLIADLNTMGAGILPRQLHMLHATELAGPFVLQVDEIVDIGSAIRSRYKEKPPNANRCLKLSMTDGVQRVYGLEYRPIKDLKVLMSAGFKIAIHHVTVRRGLLMLVPEVIIMLGGYVKYLEAARQRVVQHVNKPPRGLRGMGANSKLAESASLAAWPINETSSNRITDEGNLGHVDNCATEGMQGGGRFHDPQERTDAFTYLAMLNKMWSVNQRGDSERTARIKCVITGVKEFQFKQQDEFKLVVYVDDGSEIMALPIDNNVVEHLVGCSSSQASAALASTNASEVISMKAKLSQFQTLLTRFEGILVLRKDNSSAPVVQEMIEGIVNSEIWSLLGRLEMAARDDWWCD